jgi:hypothetical protein
MNNFRKIGLTALAGSLVASVAVAGDLAVTGAAEMAVNQYMLDQQMQVILHQVLVITIRLIHTVTCNTTLQQDC